MAAMYARADGGEIFARLQPRIDRESSTCWLWTGARGGSGRNYGVSHLDGRQQYVHRIVWQLVHGPISEGMQVLHRCDVPRCCNPEHLFLGSQKDNIDDARSKGRLATGERHGLRLRPEASARGERHGTKTMPGRISRGEHRPAAKLCADDVRAIRKRSDVSPTVLAREYGVSRSVIRAVLERSTWRHVSAA
jgi:hypothetical protein